MNRPTSQGKPAKPKPTPTSSGLVTRSSKALVNGKNMLVTTPGTVPPTKPGKGPKK